MCVHGADPVLQADEVPQERGVACGTFGVHAEIGDAPHHDLPWLRHVHLPRLLKPVEHPVRARLRKLRVLQRNFCDVVWHVPG